MTFRNYLNDANTPGTPLQGIEMWGPDGPSIIDAVTDFVFTVPGFPVDIFPLENDVGAPLSITSVSVRVPEYGAVELVGDRVTFTPDPSVFAGLAPGETIDVTIDYSITDGENFDSGFIIVRVQRQYDIWIDEDDYAVLDEDDYFITLYPDLTIYVWIDQDAFMIIDEDDTVIQTG